MAIFLALSMVSTAAASLTFFNYLRRFLPSSCYSTTKFDHPLTATAGVRRLPWPAIASLTGDFTSAVIGDGGFSTVYLGRLPDSCPVAVKVLHNSAGSSDRVLRAFRRELDLLLILPHHPRITRLLAFSDDAGALALVFEYVPGGTLRDRLHCPVSLSWSHRMRVALHVAEAVKRLHEGDGGGRRREVSIVHGDVTAANVLLDGDGGGKVCDFGSARAGFEAAVVGPGEPVVGSPGYADPYYLRTGIVSKKSDVYGFGVLLLELVSGRPAFVEGGGETMAAAVRRTGERSVTVDLRLGREFDEEEVRAVVRLAARCVGEQPSLRPSMSEVVRVMTEEVASSMSAVNRKSDG